MSGLTHPGILRWKEWVPLVTQQLRLRNLIQLIAYNIKVPCNSDIKKRRKMYYYYTLHLTAMSSPFYTSDQLESENPKWAELDIKNEEYGSANGVVIRLWTHTSEEEEDSVITVWGVYFTGLVYIGSQLGAIDPNSFCSNSVVFHMHGGYFTAPHCFVNPQPVTPRTLTIQLNALQVKPSYNVKLLLKFQSLKHAIKKESLATSILRDQISESMFSGPPEDVSLNRGSATLRKLMSKNAPPKADPHQVHSLKKEIETAKFRVLLLRELRDMAQTAVQKKLTEKNILLEKNEDRESALMENLCCLRRDAEKKRGLKFELDNCTSYFGQTTAFLDMRRRELITQLSYIYPIKQLPDGRYTIRDVHLPNSEDFEGKDELMISVALGFVAHLVQMISYFLNVPTRYPICHFGSRSKIIDHISANIPDKEREFPLFSRGKDRLAFDYGVYLLNKNIAQLRWYCGLSTSDLRHTLPNLHSLMYLNKKEELKRCLEIRKQHKKTGLSSSLDQGLNNVTVNEVNSDPQHYTVSAERRRVLTDRGGPPIHDLASLMSLDIPVQELGKTASNESSKNNQLEVSLRNPSILQASSSTNLSSCQNLEYPTGTVTPNFSVNSLPQSLNETGLLDLTDLDQTRLDHLSSKIFTTTDENKLDNCYTFSSVNGGNAQEGRINVLSLSYDGSSDHQYGHKCETNESSSNCDNMVNKNLESVIADVSNFTENNT